MIFSFASQLRRLGVICSVLALGALAHGQQTGLWLGEITLDKVAETKDGAGGTPTPTPHPINLTILLHVASDGQVRLLKEAWLVKTRVTAPAQPVQTLVINPALLANYDGVVERAGTLVGLRWSTAFFPFSGVTPPLLTGTFASGETLTGTLSLAAGDPLNPYRHKYHPDHGAGVALGRAISLTVSPPVAEDPPGAGVTFFRGTYAETVTGLHKLALKTSGTITLTRLSAIGALVQ